MNHDTYARTYFSALVTVVLLMIGLVLWGHSRGGGEDADRAEFRAEMTCVLEGYSVAYCSGPLNHLRD